MGKDRLGLPCARTPCYGPRATWQPSEYPNNLISGHLCHLFWQQGGLKDETKVLGCILNLKQGLQNPAGVLCGAHELTGRLSQLDSRRGGKGAGGGGGGRGGGGGVGVSGGGGGGGESICAFLKH